MFRDVQPPYYFLSRSFTYAVRAAHKSPAPDMMEASTQFATSASSDRGIQD
jgi:hypothetical protein